MVVTLFGTLNGSMMTAPRIFFAAAEDRLFPAAIARVDPRTHAPTGAIVLMTVMGMIFILVRTFTALADQFIIGIWPFYALAVAGVFVLRRTRPRLERPYKTLTITPAKAGAEARNAFVIAHVDVAPNTQAPMLLQQLADASRQEPGNLRFDVLQHAMRGNHFTVVEQWRNQDALDAHVATPHARAYRDALQPLTGSPLDERVYAPITR